VYDLRHPDVGPHCVRQRLFHLPAVSISTRSAEKRWRTPVLPLREFQRDHEVLAGILVPLQAPEAPAHGRAGRDHYRPFGWNIGDDRPFEQRAHRQITGNPGAQGNIDAQAAGQRAQRVVNRGYREARRLSGGIGRFEVDRAARTEEAAMGKLEPVVTDLAENATMRRSPDTGSSADLPFQIMGA